MIGLVVQVFNKKCYYYLYRYIYIITIIIGNGAPRWQFNKQNLTQLLEPSNNIFQTPVRHRNFNSSIDTYTSYNPSVNTSMTSPRRFRSDHHNRYELNPR